MVGVGARGRTIAIAAAEAAALDALGDAHRRAILALLKDGDRAVHEIADALPISRPAVSRHLRLLKAAGLVAEEDAGTPRLDRVRPEGLEAIRGYLEPVWDEAAIRSPSLADNPADGSANDTANDTAHDAAGKSGRPRKPRPGTARGRPPRSGRR